MTTTSSSPKPQSIFLFPGNQSFQSLTLIFEKRLLSATDEMFDIFRHDDVGMKKLIKEEEELIDDDDDDKIAIRIKRRREVVDKWILQQAKKENQSSNDRFVKYQEQQLMLTEEDDVLRVEREDEDMGDEDDDNKNKNKNEINNVKNKNERTLLLYKDNLAVADAFLMAAGKLSSAFIDAYEESLSKSSSKNSKRNKQDRLSLADFSFTFDGSQSDDDDNNNHIDDDVKKKRRKKVVAVKSNNANKSTFRALLEVFLLIAESDELKNTQLRLLPFRFLEDVFMQSSIEDCAVIVDKYLFSENFIPKDPGYEDGDYYPHDIDGMKYDTETRKKRKKSKTALINTRDVYDRLIAIMDIKKEWDDNGLRKLKTAREIYEIEDEKYDCGDECQVIMLKTFDELLNRASLILHAEFRGKLVLMSNGIQDFAEGAHLAAGIDFIAEEKCTLATKENTKKGENIKKESMMMMKEKKKGKKIEVEERDVDDDFLHSIVIDDSKMAEKVLSDASKDFGGEDLESAVSPKLYFAFWQVSIFFREPLNTCKNHVGSESDFNEKIVRNLNVVLEKIVTMSPFKKEMLKKELLDQLAHTGASISSARAFPFQMRDGFFLRNFLAQAAMFLHFVIFQFSLESSSALKKEHEKESTEREAMLQKKIVEENQGRVIIDGIKEWEEREAEEEKAFNRKPFNDNCEKGAKFCDEKKGDEMNIGDNDDVTASKRKILPKFGFSESVMEMWSSKIVPIAKECFDHLLNVVEKTDLLPEHGKNLRMFLVANLYSTEHYENWINMGCPSFERKQIDIVAEQKEYERREKEKEEVEKAKFPEGYVKFDHPEMERIWNLYPSHEAAMTDPERIKYGRPEFMKEFLQVVYDEMDPAAQIEEEYKRKNDNVYKWKAFRLIRQWNFAAFSKMKNFDLETIVPEILGLEPPSGWVPHNPPRDDFCDNPNEVPADDFDGKDADKKASKELTDEDIDRIIEETEKKLQLEKKALEEQAKKSVVIEEQRKRSPQRVSSAPIMNFGRGERGNIGRGASGGSRGGHQTNVNRGGAKTQMNQQQQQQQQQRPSRNSQMQQILPQRDVSRDRYPSQVVDREKSQQHQRQLSSGGRGRGEGGRGEGGGGRSGPPHSKRTRR